MSRRSSYYNNYWPRYEPSRPIEADGIKAKSQRGKFVENWWADRWINALTPLMDSRRLSRGRRYARRGQVLEIDVAPGTVTARVQGSRRSPYKIRIELAPLSDAQWDRVFDALAEQAIYAVQLLNGEMPDDIESVLRSVKVSLFPTTRSDLTTSCSCPDWANPCKHIAAVYYLLGERFDEDPFLLFKLRGRDQAAVSAALRKRRAGGAAAMEPAPLYVPEGVGSVEVPPLAEQVAAYWEAGEARADLAVHVAAPEVELALLKRVGIPPFVNAVNFRVQLTRACQGVTDRAIALAFAERDE
jgi:uncharacterized Zn finger protein